MRSGRLRFCKGVQARLRSIRRCVSKDVKVVRELGTGFSGELAF